MKLRVTPNSGAAFSLNSTLTTLISAIMVFSLFPDLFIFAPLGVLLLRVGVGLYFLVLGSRYAFASAHTRRIRDMLRDSRAIHSIMLMTVGLLLTVGLYTQGAALVGALLMLLSLERSFRDSDEAARRPLIVLLGIISVALLFLGPGALAIDIPL